MMAWDEEVDRRSRPYTRWVQQSLNSVMGLRLKIDGLLGPQTRSAIRSFQKKRGLAADGVVGPATERSLLQAGAPQLPSGGGTPRLCETLQNFDFDSAALKSVNVRKIEALAGRIEASYATARPIRTVYVKGHTDPVGTATHNRGLGLKRAMAVRGKLMQTLGRRRHQVLVLASSRGEKDPVYPTAEQNRRVEVCLSTRQLQPKAVPAPNYDDPRFDDRVRSLPNQPVRPGQRKCDEAELKRKRAECIKQYGRCLARCSPQVVVEQYVRTGKVAASCIPAFASGIPRGLACLARKTPSIYYELIRDMEDCRKRCLSGGKNCSEAAKDATNCR
jgi:outer membrane protein OmpA-like peptidoglycan-associated protein